MVPASSTRAMCGWSINRQRLAARPRTWRDLPRIHARLDDFERHPAADRRRWSATKTRPMPPSPICSSSLYGPITVPGSALRRRDRKPSRQNPAPAPSKGRSGLSCAQKKGVQMLAKDGVASAGPLENYVALAHRTLQRLVKDRFLRMALF